MNEEELNISIRIFLLLVGVCSLCVFEHAVARSLQDGSIGGTESFPARMTLEIAGLKLRVDFDGEIRLA